MAPENLISKIVEETEKENVQDATDCYVEVRDTNKRGERFEIVLHHADGSETPAKLVGRNKFIYLLALLISREGKSVAGLTTTHFSYIHNALSDLAEDIRVNTDSSSEWIDEFIYAEKPEALDRREGNGGDVIGRCALNAYRYSNAYSGANRAIKACCANQDEYETFRLRSTGGRNAVITLAVDPSQIELPDALLDYLDELPTQKEIASHRPMQTKELTIKRLN